MTAVEWTWIAVAVGAAGIGVLALIGNHQTATNRPEEHAPMALIDYRKFIDDFRDVDGAPAFVAVEVVAQNAISPGIGEGFDTEAIIALDTYAAGRHTTQLRLTEHDAGAFYDALGGAMRAITGPVEELPPITSWGDLTAKEHIRQQAAAILTENDDEMQAAADALADQLRALTRAQAIELTASAITYAAAVVATMAGGIAATGATVDLQQAEEAHA